MIKVAEPQPRSWECEGYEGGTEREKTQRRAFVCQSKTKSLGNKGEGSWLWLWLKIKAWRWLSEVLAESGEERLLGVLGGCF